MSKYYRSQRTKNLYDPFNHNQYKVSRSKLDLFINCPRCFYLDRRLGIAQPPGFPFNLNSAVDALLKKEFDFYRARQEPHPLMIENHIEALPFQHAKIDDWRNSLHHGIQFPIPNTNLTLTGGVDDVWISINTQELMIVDYKATSKADQVTIDADWQIGYKRQAEIYQWLFRQNGFVVSNTAYFVYCNGRTNVDRFDKQLVFDISLIPYVGNDNWVENAIRSAYECLRLDEIPKHNDNCDYCCYTQTLQKVLNGCDELNQHGVS